MKLRHFYPCLLAAGMAVTMASCSEEASLSQGQGRNVTMTVSISRVGENTRSVLKENSGDLKCTWESSDLILVVDKAGNKLGVLTLSTGANEETATFKGEINTDITGAADINFLYLGSKSAEDLNALSNPVVLDYSAQDGTLDWLSKNDFFTGTQNVVITNSYVSVESVSLSRQISFGKFEMQLPAGVTYGGEPITVSGTGLNTKASVSMTDGTASFSDEASITITRPEDTTATDFYLTVLPGTITPTFSVTIGGKTYSCTLGQKEWEASKFVRKDNLDGTYTGVVLSMTDPSNPNKPQYPGYEDEDPRNPLHKFAKYNLTRGKDNLNMFVEKEEEYGALYQWGRYYGFVDNKSNYTSGRYSVSASSYIQFVDALGSKSSIGDYESWDYSVYEEEGKDYYYYPDKPYSDAEYIPIVVGLNYYGQPEDMWGMNSPYWDRPNIYSSKDQIVVDRPHYMMNGLPDGNRYLSLQRHGSKYTAYVDEYTNSADYWVSKFDTETIKGGNTWAERSNAQGFAEDKANPCPEGWRLPSSDEMAEIIPENGLYEKNGNLSNLVQNYSELRISKEGYKYAIRWNYGNSMKYIEIEAVVVDDSYTSATQFTSAFWDKHKDDKVVRVFPFTGGIRPYIGKVYGSSTWDTMICRPISMGKPSFTSITWGWMFAIGLVTPNETGGINDHFGGYWVNEKDQAFKFCAGNYEREVNGNVRESDSEYTRIRMEETGPAFGMAIRPVMDK